VEFIETLGIGCWFYLRSRAYRGGAQRIGFLPAIGLPLQFVGFLSRSNLRVSCWLGREDHHLKSAGEELLNSVLGASSTPWPVLSQAHCKCWHSFSAPYHRSSLVGAGTPAVQMIDATEDLIADGSAVVRSERTIIRTRCCRSRAPSCSAKSHGSPDSKTRFVAGWPIGMSARDIADRTSASDPRSPSGQRRF